LPQSSDIRIGHFTVDIQVLGNDTERGVTTRGYGLERSAGHITKTVNDFAPSGDLSVEYTLRDRTTDATAWGFSDGTADRFVTLALRPKLPRADELRARDYAIVIDGGRSMFGERWARASRLAIELASQMDRRDRVTVLTCDLRCRRLDGDLRAPGAATAHDVEQFLASTVPEGATDVAFAVREARRALGSRSDREKRLVVLSDGLAGAGYRRPGRLADEVTDAVADPLAQLVAVPIGSDADTVLLADAARGGGGVVVPFVPGERVETAALDVLNATFGRTLRDVTVELPSELTDASPRVLAPIRSGSEVIVAARAGSDRVRGDVIVRGRLGNEPFEARYPIDLTITSDAGNAFVPRLFAAARIADLERNDASRAEVVSLSQRFAVPSRFTSLLVLESEAMFQAFGIARTARATAWTGETLASGVDVARKDFDFDDRETSLGQLASGGGGLGFAADGAPAPSTQAKAAPAARAADELFEPRTRPAPRGPGRWMKRVWHREASIAPSLGALATSEKISAARAALAASPNERSRHAELARILARADNLDELESVVLAWQARDPVDPDALAARADLALRRGDRTAALRVLDGIAQALSAPSSATLAQLALAHERAGDDGAACSLRAAAAEVAPADADAVARVVRCERALGRTSSADRWLRSRDAATSAVDAALAALDRNHGENVSFGDVIVDATWSDPDVDLDLAVLDPSGNRLSWSGRGKGVRVAHATSHSRETLAISSFAAGAFFVEITGAHRATTNVAGTLVVRALGQRRTVPFVLAGTHAVAARVDVRLVSELVSAGPPVLR
jgi:hypothetical protein